MVLFVRHSDDYGFCIEGDHDGLGVLLQLFDKAKEAQSARLAVPVTANSDPKPYNQFVNEIILTLAMNKVTIKLEDNSLTIKGPKEKLAIFFENIKFLVNQCNQKQWSESEHIHSEYYHSHPFLDESSDPIIIESFKNRMRQSETQEQGLA